MRMQVKQRKFLYLALTLLVCLLVVGVQNLASGCYGPHITAEVDKATVELNGVVTVTGMVCPAEYNKTVRIDFTRPDYTYLDLWTTTDENGNFSITQQLDMVGYWNVFAINGHICDRLYANVTDPNNPLAKVPVVPPLPPFKTNYYVIIIAISSVSVAAVVMVAGTKNKTRKISSLRLFVQVSLVFLIFFGIFVDHQNIPVPAEQLAPHEFLIGTNIFGVSVPEGLPVPFFGCYYPCGRTVNCALWQIQAYIYPFWDAQRGWGVDYVSEGIERLAVVFGSVIVLSVLLGKAFCGWVCPFGLYMDLLTRLRKALKIKHRNLSDGFNEKFHQLGYVILALILILSVVFGAEALAGTQLIPGTEEGGFIYTYFSAPFCQVCPMKPLCLLSQTSVGIIRPEWIVENTAGQFYQLGLYLTSLNLLVLGLVTVASFFYRRAWCRICPLGALIALFHRFPPFKWVSILRLDKQEEKCTKCGVCKRVCPTQVADVYEKKGGDVTHSNCIMCMRCVEMCPYEDALKLKAVGKTVLRSRNWLE